MRAVAEKIRKSEMVVLQTTHSGSKSISIGQKCRFKEWLVLPSVLKKFPSWNFADSGINVNPKVPDKDHKENVASLPIQLIDELAKSKRPSVVVM